jgi:hypothetical protein
MLASQREIPRQPTVHCGCMDGWLIGGQQRQRVRPRPNFNLIKPARVQMGEARSPWTGRHAPRQDVGLERPTTVCQRRRLYFVLEVAMISLNRQNSLGHFDAEKQGVSLPPLISHWQRDVRKRHLLRPKAV